MGYVNGRESGSSSSSSSSAFDPSTATRLFEDFQLGFYSGGSGQIQGEQTSWQSLQSGTPTIAVNSGTSVPSTAQHPGVLELGTSTDAAYGAGVTSGVFGGATYPGFVIGGGQITFESLVKLPTISNGTDNAQINVGFRDGPGWVAAVNGCHIQFQRETSLNWQLIVTASSTQTVLDSGIPVTSGWHKLKIVTSADGLSIEGFVDGVSMGAPVTTNIPSAKIPPMCSIRKTLGTTPMFLGVDYIKIDKTLSVAR